MKYIGPLFIYKIKDPYNYVLVILEGKILRDLFQHKRSNQLSLGQAREISIIYLN